MIWTKALVILLWSGFTLVTSATIPFNDTEALEFSGDTELGPEEYLKLLYTGDDYLLIGGREYLYNVSSVTMEVNKRHQWKNNGTEGVRCNSFYTAYNGDCFNYVQSAHKVSDTLFVICGAAGIDSLCKKLEYTESGVWNLTSVNINADDHHEFRVTTFFAPPWHWTRHLIHTTSEGVMYAMSMRVDRSGIIPVYQFGRTESAQDPPLITKATNDIISVDTVVNSQLKPVYSGMFDTSEHVYFLYSEAATETFNSYSTVRAQYSRIGRVCKNDKAAVSNTFFFTSFFKARILCGKRSATVGVKMEKLMKTEGYYQSYIDVIEDNSQPHLSSIEGANGEKIILALFSNPKGAVRGSAICAYRVSDIEASFTSNKVINGSGVLDVDDPTKCVADSHSMTEAERNIRSLTRLSKPVTSIDEDALFFVEGYRMTRMVVDWQVEAADGKKYDVVFVSTDDGRLVKLVKYTKEGDSEERYHIVEERTIFQGKPIEELELIVDEWGKKHLVISTYGDMKRVAVEKCHHYVGCMNCLALRDPYCGWSHNLDKCVSTSHEAEDKLADIERGTDQSCYGEYTTKTEDVDEKVTTDKDLVTGPTVIAPVGRRQEAEPLSGLNTGLIVALIVVSIVLGVVGFLVGMIVGKKRYMSPTPHLDQELTNKNKEADALKNQNCSDYQLPPGKPSNLQVQYQNNLHGNNTIVDGQGETTLQRQKKVYV